MQENAPITFPHTNGRLWSGDHFKRLLIRGEITALELIPWSSNYTYAVRIQLDSNPGTLAVYKPRRGEIPLWDFPDGTLYKREYAAYVACRLLGWDFIPLTVIRDGPHGIGSVQLFVDHEPRADFFSFKSEFAEQLQRIALFDVIANNADRKGGHCLRASDGKIWGIDHGLTFHPQFKLRTVIWDFSGEPIPDALLGDLDRFLADSRRLAAMRRALGDLLDPVEVEMFFERIGGVLEMRTYPGMTSRRSHPWPRH